jgi:uncharacterized membrane protein
MSKELHAKFHRNDRIEMFSDGVFAIVVTLLVFQITVPVLKDPKSSSELLRALLDIKGKLISFVLSFCFIVMLWVAHNIWFRTLAKTDSVVLWVNNLFLLLVCFVPFPTALIGSYPENSAAMILFGTDWALIAVVMYLVGRYCFNNGFVLRAVDHKRYKEALTVMGFILPFSIAPIVISIWYPEVSLLFYLLQVIIGVVISFRIRLEDVLASTEE